MTPKRVATRGELHSILDLIVGYQKFYGVQTDREKTFVFFSQFVDSTEKGILFAVWDHTVAWGFCTLYFNPSSLIASQCCVFNDLFVHPEHRGKGIAKALFFAASEYAIERGFTSLEWMTQKENARAQGLYDTLPQSKTEWFNYSSKTIELAQALKPYVK